MTTIPRGFLQLLSEPWRAQPDDTAGGWCVTLYEDPRSPGSGALAIAMFLSQEVAVHIAETHNASLANTSGDASAAALPDQRPAETSLPPG